MRPQIGWAQEGPSLLEQAQAAQEVKSATADLRRSLASLARNLAKEGYAEAAQRVFEVYRDLGAEDKELERVQRWMREAEADAPERPKASKAMRKASAIADALAALVADHQGEAGRVLARATLAFLPDHELSHERLGDLRGPDGQWLNRRTQLRDQAAARLGDLARQAEALSFDCESWTLQEKRLQGLYPQEMHAFRYGDLTLAATGDRVWVQHHFEEALRAMAFARALAGGPLQPHLRPSFVVFLPHRDRSEKFWDRMRKARGPHAEGSLVRAAQEFQKQHRRSWHVQSGRGGDLRMALIDAADASLSELEGMDSAPPLWFQKSHRQYVSLLWSGEHVDHANWTRKNPLLAPNAPEKRAGLHYWRSGLWGTDQWIRFLAGDQADPSLADCAAKGDRISGDFLLKASHWLSWVQEQDRFQDLLGTELDLEAEEARWRTWLQQKPEESEEKPSIPDLVDAALHSEQETQPTLLDRLNRLRRSRGMGSMIEDPILTRTAERLARSIAAEKPDLPKGLAQSLPALSTYPPDLQSWWMRRNALVIRGLQAESLEAHLRDLRFRLAVLHPGVAASGVGQAGEYTVLDLISARSELGEWQIYFPSHGQFHLPIADEAGQPLALSLTLSGVFRGPTAEMELLNEEGQSIACDWVEPGLQLGWGPEARWSILAYPKETLEPLQLYRWKVQFANWESPYELSFATEPSEAQWKQWKRNQVGSSKRLSSRERKAKAARQESIDLALAWLAAHQDPSGSWKPDEYVQQALDPNLPKATGQGEAWHELGITSLVLLAFLNQGHSPVAGDYQVQVQKGLQWLLREQHPKTRAHPKAPAGLFGHPDDTHVLYHHAMATLALTEACRQLQGTPALRVAVEKAVQVIHQARNPYGVWRYSLEPNGDGDTSLAGWLSYALIAAESLGIPRVPEAEKGVLGWIREMTDSNTGRTGYSHGNGGGPGGRPPRMAEHVQLFPAEKSESCTALALAVQMAWTDPLAAVVRRDHPDFERMQRQVNLLLSVLPVWDLDGGGIDTYYWYWGSQAMAQWGGREREQWHKALDAVLLKHQRKDGNFRGSWDPVGPWGLAAGRLYSTAISVLSLEPLPYGLRWEK